jgi:hypothetical protein
MEATMIATLVLILAALVLAVLGCAWVGPINLERDDEPTRQRRT